MGQGVLTVPRHGLSIQLLDRIETNVYFFVISGLFTSNRGSLLIAMIFQPLSHLLCSHFYILVPSTCKLLLSYLLVFFFSLHLSLKVLF